MKKIACLYFLFSYLLTAEEVLSPSIEEQKISSEDPKSDIALSPVEIEMQKIEPGFKPKTDQAVQLFLLQKAVKDIASEVQQKEGKIKDTKDFFIRKFRQDLGKIVQNETDPRQYKLQLYLDEIIRFYEIALVNNPHHSYFTADILYNVGRAYFEQDEKKYFDELARYNDAREAGREDVSYPEENFSRTIDTYERLITDYPLFDKMDNAYYLLGLAYWYEGAFNQAVDRFQTLIKKFPNSRFIDEVWFRLGEFFYDMDEYDNAISSYEKIAQKPTSKFYDKALYKIGWSYFQKDDFVNAVKSFTKVLDITYNQSLDATATGMRNEVTRYIVKSFFDQLTMEESGLKTVKKKPVTKPVTKNPDNAKKSFSKEEQEYFEKTGRKLVSRISNYLEEYNYPPYSRDILVELASQLLDASMIDGAVLAFEKTIDLDKKNVELPRLATQIVNILQEAGRDEEARERNHAIIKNFGKNSSWYQSNSGNISAQEEARKAVRDAILSLAVYYHKNGKNNKESGDNKNAEINFKKAASLYALYVREYPEREDTDKAIFYFAEAAFELNKFRIALEAYQLLKNYPLPMPENIRINATLNIVFTFRHVLEAESVAGNFKEIDFDNLTSKQRGMEEQAIPDLGKKYLDAIDEFLQIAPNDDQVPVLLFHAAAIYYVYGYADESIKRFYYIIDTYPATTAALVSARLIIDDAVAKEQWQKVAELSRLFAEKNLSNKKGEFAKIESNARFKIARSMFEEANELYKQNQINQAKVKYKESAELFAQLLKEDPKNPYADIMLFNMARAVDQSGTMTMALPLYKKVFSEYPNSEYAKSAQFRAALILEKTLKFKEAALAYDAIIKKHPTSESAGDAMLNKALLYEAAEDHANATQAFLEFAKRFPDREEAPIALIAAASIFKKQGKTTQQIAMLEQFIRQYSKDKNKIPSVIEAHVQIAETYADLERLTTSPSLKKRYQKDRDDNYKKAVNLYKLHPESPIAAYFASKAELILEKPEQDSFKTMTINAKTGKAQAEQLTAMMKRLTELQAKNEAIIKTYAQPVSNAESLRRIGSLYEHLAKTLVKSPCPKDVAAIDEFACDEYLVLLEDKAAVLEEKALDTYKQAYDIALTAYDAPPNLMDNILAGLNRLRPGEYKHIGNLIEKPYMGELYGSGRMLSDGRMAALLHEKESDPDVAKIAEPEPKKEEIKEETKGEIKEDSSKIIEESPADLDLEEDLE